jgi:hypothetical protein
VFRAVTLLTALVSLAGLAWAALYPAPDPKNLRYVLWKAGLPTIDPDLALDSMVADRHPEHLVVGRTPEELRTRFGSLTPLRTASPYLRGCHANSSWSKSEVVFLRSSPWMVVLEDGRARDLVLIKGC